MKLPISFLILLTFLLFGRTNVLAQDEVDCEPEAVKEWMIQRQVGRNIVQSLLSSEVEVIYLDAMLEIQRVRRELEDLERPSCVDELYELTIYLYDASTDLLAFILANDREKADEILSSRFERYGTLSEPIYNELQEIAGVDIMAEAAKILPVPTSQPTSEPLVTITFAGEQGGVVLGPEEIPTGTYIVTLTGEGNLFVTIEGLNGTCTGTFLAVPFDANKPEDTIQKVFESANCRALLEIGNSDKPWILVFEPVE